MTSIGFINGIAGTAPLGSGAADARQGAMATIGEVGHRVLAWAEALGDRGGAAQGWSADVGAPSGFRPDTAELSRGGDVYGLGELATGLSAQHGATPAEEGDLLRSLEGFTRDAVVQLVGLSGAAPDRQLAGIREALASAADATTPEGVGGIAQRLDVATAILAGQNGR